MNKVNDYSLENEILLYALEGEDEYREMKSEDFFQWLDKIDELDTCDDYPHCGEHIQVLGKINNLYDYFHSVGFPYACAKIGEYLDTRDTLKSWDITTPLKSIFSHFNSAV